MFTKVLIGSAVGMAAVTRIKNENLRASIGIPLVALMMFSLLSMSVGAQWRPDKTYYNIVSDGNFYTTAHDMSTAIAIAMGTLEYNGAVLRTINVDFDDFDTPLFSHFHRKSSPGNVYICYVTRNSNGYVIWFRYLIDEPIEFEEEYAILEYEGLD